jgi:hypothetical protein
MPAAAPAFAKREKESWMQVAKEQFVIVANPGH